MDLEWLKASEFYAFIALAAWLVYRQFVKPWLVGERPGNDAAPARCRGEDAPGQGGGGAAP